MGIARSISEWVSQGVTRAGVGSAVSVLSEVLSTAEKSWLKISVDRLTR
jgi:hypothetical protein